MEEQERELKAFILEEQEKFYRIAYSYVKTREAALDVVQDTILTSYEKLYTLRKPEFMKTWFYRILINNAITYIRKNKRFVSLAYYQDRGESQGDKIDEALDLYQAVTSLKPKWRTVVLLRYFEDMKISDIAEVLQCPESTVKSRLKKALEELRKEIGDDIYEGKVTLSSKSI